MAGATLVAVPNEFIVPRLLWNALLKREIVLLPTHAVLPWFKEPIDKLVHWLVASKRAARVADVSPELEDYVDGVGPEYRFDVFHRIEPWMARYFHFEGIDQILGAYALVYKSAACSFLRTCLATPVVLHALFDRLGAKPLRIIGVRREVLEIYNVLYGKNLLVGPSPGLPVSRIINFTQTILVFAAAAFQILLGCFRSPDDPKGIRLGADYIGDARDVEIYDALGGEQETVLIARNDRFVKEHAIKLPEYRCVTVNAGSFSLRQAAEDICGLVGDVILLYRNCRDLAPFHFWIVIDSARKRRLYRGLINRFGFRNFWGRDDYNPEHIVRSQELRACGARSLGLNHGFPVLAAVVPHFRYIDFDAYFTFGEHLHRRYYHQTWPANIKVVASGCCSMTSTRLLARNDPKSKDIAIFLKIGYWPRGEDERLVGFVSTVAAAFPDRKVIVKFKSERRAPQSIQDAIASWQAAPNIVIAEQGMPYDILGKVGYSISDPSTVAAEAIQYGAISFVIDFPQWTSLIFRDFRDLMIQSAEEAIGRIRALEAGTGIYARATFESLIRSPARPFPELVAQEALP
jgi:hypothetical protein